MCMYEYKYNEKFKFHPPAFVYLCKLCHLDCRMKRGKMTIFYKSKVDLLFFHAWKNTYAIQLFLKVDLDLDVELTLT